MNECGHCLETGARVPTIEDVRAAAGDVFTAEAVDIWMETPNPSLVFETPAELVADGEGARVLSLIAALAEGVTF